MDTLHEVTRNDDNDVPTCVNLVWFKIPHTAQYMVL